MAALRSALAMLRRGSSGSSAVGYMGGRGLEISQVFRHAAPPLLPAPAPLHPAAIPNLGCRHFSTGMREPADKAKSGLRMWQWRQWAKDRMQNGPIEEKNRLMFVYTVFVLGTPAVAVFKTTSEVLRL